MWADDFNSRMAEIRTPFRFESSRQPARHKKVYTERDYHRPVELILSGIGAKEMRDRAANA
jgi:hypothetical protein